MRSTAAVTETAASIVVVECFDHRPFDIRDGLHQQLRNAIATAHVVVDLRVVVDHDYLQLTAISSIDDARSIDQ